MSCVTQPSPSMNCDHRFLTPEHWEKIRCSLKLSMRELQITQHVFDDNKAEYIAAALGISVHTVNTYLQRLYTKLDVRSRSQLVLRIVRAYLEILPTLYSLIFTKA